jgi:hypothetical protein
MVLVLKWNTGTIWNHGSMVLNADRAATLSVTAARQSLAGLATCTTSVSADAANYGTINTFHHYCQMTVALLQLLFLALWLVRRLIPACRRHHRSTCLPHLTMSLTQPAQHAQQKPWRPLMVLRAAVDSWEPHRLWPTWLS